MIETVAEERFEIRLAQSSSPLDFAGTWPFKGKGGLDFLVGLGLVGMENCKPSPSMMAV